MQLGQVQLFHCDLLIWFKQLADVVFQVFEDVTGFSRAIQELFNLPVDGLLVMELRGSNSSLEYFGRLRFGKLLLDFLCLLALFLLIFLFDWLPFLVNGLWLGCKQIFLSLVTQFFISNNNLLAFFFDFSLLQFFWLFPFELCNHLFDISLFRLQVWYVTKEISNVNCFFVTLSFCYFTYGLAFLHKVYSFIKEVLLPIFNTLCLFLLLANTKSLHP